MAKDITPRKPSANIRLKLLSIETIQRQAFDSGLPFLDIIATDDLGTRVGIVVKNQLKKKYETLLQEQSVFVFKNAFVLNNSYKNNKSHVVHDSKLMVTNKTSLVAVPASEWVGSDGFKFVNFSDLINCQFPEKASADVIGRVNFYNREPKPSGSSVDEKSQHINLELMNLSGEIVSCTLWASYMTKFLSYMKDIPDNQVVVLIIQFGKTTKFGKCLTVTSDWNFTRIHIDSDLQVIKDFKQSYLQMHGQENSEQTLGPSLTPSLTPRSKTVEEFFKDTLSVECCDLSVDKTGNFVVHAEIIAIEPDEAWCYIACKKCHRKATPISKNVDLTISIDDQLALKRNCAVCGDNPQVALRFKVSVRVADDNGIATLTLFESQVLKYVNESAYTIAKKMPDDLDVPVELDALTDNTMLFKLEITGNNKKYKSANYTVKDASTEPAFIDKYKEQFKVDRNKFNELYIKGDATDITESAKCTSSSNPDDKDLAVNLSNNTTGYTPPKKVIKQEPKASPLSVNCSSNRAKKSIDLGGL